MFDFAPPPKPPPAPTLASPASLRPLLPPLPGGHTSERAWQLMGWPALLGHAQTAWWLFGPCCARCGRQLVQFVCLLSMQFERRAQARPHAPDQASIQEERQAARPHAQAPNNPLLQPAPLLAMPGPAAADALVADMQEKLDALKVGGPSGAAVGPPPSHCWARPPSQPLQTARRRRLETRPSDPAWLLPSPSDAALQAALADKQAGAAQGGGQLAALMRVQQELGALLSPQDAAPAAPAAAQQGEGAGWGALRRGLHAAWHQPASARGAAGHRRSQQPFAPL